MAHLFPVRRSRLPSIFSKMTEELGRKIPLLVLYFLPGSPDLTTFRSATSISLTPTWAPIAHQHSNPYVCQYNRNILHPSQFSRTSYRKFSKSLTQRTRHYQTLQRDNLLKPLRTNVDPDSFNISRIRIHMKR